MSKTISCPNCGAKYKVPEDTKASRAKCKACGTVIDIQAQLHAAPATPTPPKKAPASPPKAKPAPKPAEKDVELPVSARKKNPSREGIRRAASKSSRSARGRAKGGDEESGGAKRAGRSRSGRTTAGRGSRAGGRGARGSRGESAPEEKSKTPMYLGIGGGVIAVAIAAFFLLKSPPKKATPKQDQNKIAGNQEPKKAEANPNGAKVSKKEDGTSNAIAKKGDGEKTPAEASAPKKTPKKVAKKPKAKPKAKKKKKKFVYGESTTPFDAKSLDPVPFTDDTTEEEKADLKRWMKKMLEDTGFPGRKARDKIVKLGRKGVPALINALRELDYTTQEGTETASLINDGLSQIFLGLNAGLNTVQGKPKDEVAWWNAKCVRTWVRQWEAKGSGDPEEWDRFIRARKKKMK